jgi:hypothetical protein
MWGVQDAYLPAACMNALQRQNAENLKQIFPEKEYRGLTPNFHIHVSVSELYIPMFSVYKKYYQNSNNYTPPY